MYLIKKMMLPLDVDPPMHSYLTQGVYQGSYQMLSEKMQCTNQIQHLLSPIQNCKAMFQVSVDWLHCSLSSNKQSCLPILTGKASISWIQIQPDSGFLLAVMSFNLLKQKQNIFSNVLLAPFRLAYF